MSAAPKILVADDDQALSRTLSWILRENGYDVVAIPGGEHLFEHLSADRFDLLLLDIMMPKVDGLQLLQKVKSDPRYKDLPVLMISSMPPEEATVRSLGLGAADFIPKPFRVRELLARVKAQLRVGRELDEARDQARTRGELVDILQEVTASLKPDEIYQILVRRVAEALRVSRCSIVLARPGEESGTVVASYDNPAIRSLGVDLRRYPEIRHAMDPGEPVLIKDVATDPLLNDIRGDWQSEGRDFPCRSAIVVRFSLREQPAGVFFLRATGDDLPLDAGDLQFVEQVVTSAVAALEKAYDMESAMTGQEKLRHLAETDPLTNTFNRRALTEKLEQEMDRAARYATLLTCMMLDIDNFKQINDTHGHLVGDMILKQLAQLLKREQRSPDIVARYGGEEFVVLLPETNSTESRNFAERVLKRVAAYEFGEPGRPVHVTISIGLASFPDERITDGRSLLELADNHLYRAKSEGRNRYRD
jgi:two-component system cell cycle response regulator